MDYKEYNDFELLAYVSDSEEAYDILYKKYEPLIYSTAKRLINIASIGGLDMSDLMQEGMLGLTTAINNFDETKETIFYTFAKTLIERSMLTAVTTSRRLKHKALNDSVPIETEVEGVSKTLDNILKDDSLNPEVLVVSKDSEEQLLEMINKVLTDNELAVFDLKINGFNYTEIAEILESTPKQIDNSLQRIKKKIRNIMESVE